MAEIIILTPPGDNFIYLVKDSDGTAVVIDPGLAEPVSRALSPKGCHKGGLAAILLTHHHVDHRAGVGRLVRDTGAAVWSSTPSLNENLVTDGDILRFGSLVFRVIATPGHTADSVCYVLETEEGPHALFSGDTLFCGGCGRIFEGEPSVLYRSLRKLADLDSGTLVYPGHDYTAENYRFALSVEPERAPYEKALRRLEGEKAAGRPGIPTTIAEEHRSNIFLRAGDHGLKQGLELSRASDEEVFAELRRLKNRF